MDRPQVLVSALVVPALCLLVYLDEFGLVLPLLLSIVLHEAAHLAVMRLHHIVPEQIRVDLHGIAIRAIFPSAAAEALCTLAGPVCTALLALLARRFNPILCLVNTALLLYNLLPVYPLDGGRLLRIGLCALFGQRIGARISLWLGLLTALCVAAACVRRSSLEGWRLMPLLFAVFFLCKLPNISCQTPRVLLK